MCSSYQSKYIEKCTPLGPLVVCGNFNARCGDVQDVGGEEAMRCTVDHEKNHQGEALNDLLRSTICIVNGTKGKDAFTSVFSRGSSIVDYCIVPYVRTLLKMRCDGHTKQRSHQSGPEEPVRLLRFWPDQYFKLQQYFFKKTKKNTYRNVDLYRYRSSRAGAVKRHFDGYLLIKSLRYSGYYVTCKMVERIRAGV